MLFSSGGFMAGGKEGATKTRYSIVGTLVSVWILGILIGWINLTDRDFQTLQLIGITLVVIVGGEFLEASTERHHATIAHLRQIEESQGQTTGQLQQIRDELQTATAEMAKLRKQQVRDTIVLEAILAEMPSSIGGRLDEG
jgi:hypothetical protein